METIQPEKILAILKQHGTQLTLEQARLVLEFMYKLATIAISTYLGN
ncbi:hypothetical protein [Arachidicoccus ginsenosidimutans]|nr:hypothetical protein [Arachidicoccus sp. BS20]